MPRVVAIANQKGGVGKTTTTWHLAGGLVEKGFRTLVLDLDSQQSLTQELETYDELVADDGALFIADFLKSFRALRSGDFLGKALDAQIRTLPLGADLIPGSHDSAQVESLLISEPQPRLALRDFLAAVDDRYDFILLDCPALVTFMTQAGLAAADTVVIPIATDVMSVKSTNDFLTLAYGVTEELGLPLPRLVAFANLYKPHQTEDEEALSAIREVWGQILVDRPVQQSTALKHAVSQGRSIFQWTPRGEAAARTREAFQALLDEVLRDED